MRNICVVFLLIFTTMMFSCASSKKYIEPDTGTPSSNIKFTTNGFIGQPFVCSEKDEKEYLKGSLVKSDAALASEFFGEYKELNTLIKRDTDAVIGVYHYSEFMFMTSKCQNTLSFKPTEGFAYHAVFSETGEDCSLNLYRISSGGSKERDPTAGPAINRCVE